MLKHTTYFFAPPEKFSHGKVYLDEDESHHLVNVLRAKSGDEFFVANGIGQLFRCRLEKDYHKGVVASIISEEEPIQRPSISICLAMGIIRQSLMELSFDWSVQLGISAFVPISFDYSQHKMQSSKSNERLHKIAIKSMKQSKRAFLPEIIEPMSLVEFLKHYGKSYDGILFADIDGVLTPPKRMVHEHARVAILIGPEGGISMREKAELGEYGAVPLSLGSSRLRAETAAVVAVAKLLLWSGNI